MDLWRKHRVHPLSRGNSSKFTFGASSFVPRLKLHGLVLEHASKLIRDVPEKFSGIALDMHPYRIGIQRIEINGSGVVVYCTLVSWFEYEFMQQREVRGQIPKSEHFKALAVDCLVKTFDGCFILSKRSEAVSIYKGMVDVSAAGYVDAAAFLKDPYPWGEACRVLKEEVGLASTDYTSVEPLGLCRVTDPESALIEWCCSVEISLSSDQVLERAKNAKDSWQGEHFAATREEMIVILEKERVKPAGAATMLFALKR